MPVLTPGQIEPIRLKGRFQFYLLVKSHYGFTTLRYSILHNTSVTKQWIYGE